MILAEYPALKIKHNATRVKALVRDKLVLTKLCCDKNGKQRKTFLYFLGDSLIFMLEFGLNTYLRPLPVIF